MNLHFFPVSLDSISPTLDAETALAKLCDDGWARDHSLWAGVVNGEEVIRWRHGDRLLTGEQYEQVARPHLTRYQIATNLLLDALRSGEAQAFVWSPQQRSAFHVPRFYWNSRNAFDIHKPFAGLEGAGGADESMTGQPVWLSEAKLRPWIATNRQRLEEAVTAALEGASEKPKRQTKPLPKWYPQLETFMREAHQRQEDWPKLHSSLPPAFPTSAEFRRRLIAAKWPEQMVPRSTVDYHVRAIKRKLGR